MLLSLEYTSTELFHMQADRLNKCTYLLIHFLQVLLVSMSHFTFLNRKISSQYVNMCQDYNVSLLFSHSKRLHSNTLAFNKINVLFFLFFFLWTFPI